MDNLKNQTPQVTKKDAHPSFATIGRFVMIPHSFIENCKDMNFHTKWLFVVLVYYRNTKSGEAFPSYDTITKLTGMRREMISKGLKKLVESGWIKKKRRFNTSSVYKINFTNVSAKQKDKEIISSEEDSCSITETQPERFFKNSPNSNYTRERMRRFFEG